MWPSICLAPLSGGWRVNCNPIPAQRSALVLVVRTKYDGGFLTLIFILRAQINFFEKKLTRVIGETLIFIRVVKRRGNRLFYGYAGINRISALFKYSVLTDFGKQYMYRQYQNIA